jgi:hypothetical protein
LHKLAPRHCPSVVSFARAAAPAKRLVEFTGADRDAEMRVALYADHHNGRIVHLGGDYKPSGVELGQWLIPGLLRRNDRRVFGATGALSTRIGL